MFDYIFGNIASVGENKIVVDCNGVGFVLFASTNACAEYSKKSQAKIPVYLAVREDALELYGFRDEPERELFLKLLGVSGIGAKLAIAVLGGMPSDMLRSVIARGDAAALSSIKGVGKKTAERIVLELKGKLEFTDDPNVFAATAVGTLDDKAVAALIGLGYDRHEAEIALKKATADGTNMSTEEIIRAVLRGI